MAKPIIVTKIQYQEPGTTKGFRDFLKYLQYRDGSVRRDALKRGELPDPELSDAVKPEHRDPVWVDRGLGSSYKTIANNCHDWQGRKLMARKWVISPDPELMQHIPPEQRSAVMANVVEHTMGRWYAQNGWGQPEMAYVVHDKEILNKRTNEQQNMMHAHVITPGTIPVPDAPDMGRIDHYVRKPHIRDLHETTASVFEEEMVRVLGRDRVIDILRERDERLAREGREEWMRKNNITPREPADPKEKRLDMGKLAQAHDVMTMIKREQARKEAKKKGQKLQQTAKMRTQDIRMYARLTRTERDERMRRFAERERLREERDRLEKRQEQAAARQATHDQELDDAREQDHAFVENLKAKGKRIPTYRERQDYKEQTRNSHRVFFVLENFMNTPIHSRDFGDYETRREARLYERWRDRALKHRGPNKDQDKDIDR